MHFLCLHGMGTNSQVFETNSATVRYEMDHIYTFEFVEGSLACPIARGKIVQLFPLSPLMRLNCRNGQRLKPTIHDTYYQYYDMYSATSLSHALSQLANYIAEEGPFDGIFGFSQGASLAATYLIQFSQNQPSKPLPFKCAIFFSGGIPLDPQALKHGEMKFLDPKETGAMLRLPTANIWGRNDTVWPESSEMLCKLCEVPYRNVYTHQEGHDIPGARAKEAVQGSVRAIRRAIDQTLMMQ